jgi:hypothetical protein
MRRMRWAFVVLYLKVRTFVVWSVLEFFVAICLSFHCQRKVDGKAQASVVIHFPAPLLFVSDADSAHEFSNVRASKGVEFDSLFNDGFAGGLNRSGGDGDCGSAGCAVHV